MAIFRKYVFAGLFLTVCSLAGSRASAQGNPMLRKSTTRAVVVGISDYQHVTDLTYAHRDAEALAEYLQSPSGGSLPSENIRLLLNERARQADIVMALTWLLKESKEGDRAYIYFSGHGDVEKETAWQLGFLLAYDAPVTTYMIGGALPILYLQTIVKTLTAQQGVEVVLITDACRAGKLAGEDFGGNYLTAEKLAESFDNEIKILSCQQDELSQEGLQWGGGRGAFSFHLIEGLTGLADQNQDEEVSVRELRNYLEEQLYADTKGKQSPLVKAADYNQPLAKVDTQGLALLIAKKVAEASDIGTLAMRERGVSPSDPDTAIWRLYLDFRLALGQNHLLYPAEGAAYTIYEKIKEEKIIAPHRDQMTWDLAAALQNEAQQAINTYLTDPPEELKFRWQYNERYQHYPEYLGTAARLLGPGHFMYAELKTRQLYFEGLRLRLRGEIENNKALFTEALQKQETVISRDSSAAYAYNELGLLYRRLDQQEKALSCFYRANDFSPQWVLPMANLIVTYTELEQLDAAFDVAGKALRADPAFALTHHNLGYAYETAREWTKAAAQYKKAVELDANFADSYYNLGLMYYHLERLDSTEYYFLQYAERAREKEAAIWSDLGFIADLQDRQEAAVNYFDKALSIDPQYAGTYLNLGEFHLGHNRLPEAEKAYLTYVQKRPDRPIGHYMLAAVWARQGKTAQAMQQLDIAVEKGFKDAAKLEGDDHFSSLRKRKDFQDLLKKLR